MKAYRPGHGRSVWSSPLGYAAVKLLLIILATIAAVAVGYILITLRIVVDRFSRRVTRFIRNMLAHPPLLVMARQA